MGLLDAIFGGKPTPQSIARAVETVERLLRGDTATAVDAKRLPMPREQLKQALLEEIARLSSDHTKLGQLRRYARCYVDLSAFQPGVDPDRSANSELDRIMRAARGHDVVAIADRYAFRDELQQAGYGGLY